MSTFTETYGLLKPDDEDYYDVSDFNENMDAIDAQMTSMDGEINELNDAVGGIGEKMDEVKALIGTVEDVGDSTLFGQMKKQGEKRIVFSDNAQFSSGRLNISAAQGETAKYILLHTFVPPFSGNIQVKISMGTNGSSEDMGFYIVKGGHPRYFTSPDYTIFSSFVLDEFVDLIQSVADISGYLKSNWATSGKNGNTVESSCIVSVQKGIPYVFIKPLYGGTSGKFAKWVDYLKICYDIVDGAE